MNSFRYLGSSVLLVLALGCGSTQRSNDDDTANGDDGNTTKTAGNTSTSGDSGSGSSTDAAGPNSSDNASSNDGNTSTTATAMGGDGGADTGAPASTDAGSNAGSSGGASSSSGASSSNGGASSSSGGAGAVSGAGGTGVVADPGCGSHKWACWPMPNMAGSGLPNEASYTRIEDGVVLDNITQLMWDDRISAQAHMWQDAIEFCEAFEWGGFDDWRLPTRIEMTSVLDHSDDHTGWAAEAFEYPNSGFHFSASDWILTITQTGAGAGNDYAWAFNMSDGIVSNAYSKSNATPLKCVRGGGSGEGPSDPAVAPPDQYSIVAEGEVRDNYTGLIWQRGDSDDMLSWEEAVAYCKDLDLNGNSWRLPSIRELATLVDEAEVAPAINSEMFPDTKYGARSNDWYWATPQRGSAAWGLNFDDGFTGTNTGSAAWNTFGPSWARCVR
ncbi:MAG TPA: DUF1566 domain-containing protein [Polyangiaceae bacterium]